MTIQLRAKKIWKKSIWWNKKSNLRSKTSWLFLFHGKETMWETRLFSSLVHQGYFFLVGCVKWSCDLLALYKRDVPILDRSENFLFECFPHGFELWYQKSSLTHALKTITNRRRQNQSWSVKASKATNVDLLENDTWNGEHGSCRREKGRKRGVDRPVHFRKRLRKFMKWE